MFCRVPKRGVNEKKNEKIINYSYSTITTKIVF